MWKKRKTETELLTLVGGKGKTWSCDTVITLTCADWLILNRRSRLHHVGNKYQKKCHFMDKNIDILMTYIPQLNFQYLLYRPSQFSTLGSRTGSPIICCVLVLHSNIIIILQLVRLRELPYNNDIIDPTNYDIMI